MTFEITRTGSSDFNVTSLGAYVSLFSFTHIFMRAYYLLLFAATGNIERDESSCAFLPLDELCVPAIRDSLVSERMRRVEAKVLNAVNDFEWSVVQRPTR